MTKHVHRPVMGLDVVTIGGRTYKDPYIQQPARCINCGKPIAEVAEEPNRRAYWRVTSR